MFFALICTQLNRKELVTSYLTILPKEFSHLSKLTHGQHWTNALNSYLDCAAMQQYLPDSLKGTPFCNSQKSLFGALPCLKLTT